MPNALDPKHLYHLHIIFESGSLSSAAELLSVSQPTLSRTVSTLEAQVGRRLMVRGRSGRRIRFGPSLRVTCRSLNL